MSAFWIEGMAQLIPDRKNMTSENDDFHAPHFPEVIAQVKGEDYYPQTIRSWGSKTLVMVDSPVFRKFTHYWDMSGESKYYVEEYNLKKQTKTTYNIISDCTETLNNSDLAFLVSILGEERAKEQFDLHKVECENGANCYVFNHEPAEENSSIAVDDIDYNDGAIPF